MYAAYINKSGNVCFKINYTQNIIMCVYIENLELRVPAIYVQLAKYILN